MIEMLPTVNAFFNLVSFVLLILGYQAVRRKQINRHRALMVMALMSSILFLAGYLTYHAYVGTTRFMAPQPLRSVYLGILLTHTVLAGAIVPLVISTLWNALRGVFHKHRRVARWTLPLWIYVSITGVIIYVLLYVLFPQYAQRV